MSELGSISKIENLLLGLIEVSAVVKDAASTLSRKRASEMLAKEFGVDEKLVFPINIQTSSGNRDAVVHALIYKNLDDAKRQIPKHFLVRMLNKEEREKINKERASKKAEKKQAAAKGDKK
jgi:ribosomal protein S24E